MRVIGQVLFPFYKRYPILTGAGLLLVAASAALALLPGWMTGEVVNHLQQILPSQSLEEVFLPILLALGGVWLLAIVRVFTMVGMRLTLVVVSRRIERDHRKGLFEHLLHWDWQTLQRYPTGELMTYFTEDLNRLRNFTGPVILYGTHVFFMVAFTGILMLFTAWKLALAALLPLCLIVPLSYHLRMQALLRGHKQQEAFAWLSAFLQQVYPYLRPLRAMADPLALSEEWRRRVENHAEASLSVTRIEALLQPLTTLFVGVSLTIVLIYGGLQVIEKRLPLGIVAAFSVYVLQLMHPLGSLGWLMSILQQAKASAERLLQLQEAKGIITYPPISRATPQHNGWHWTGVYFGHEAGTWLFENFSGHIAPGEKIALSLPTASGKTTLARLLIRQLEPQKGEIFFGEVPLRALSYADLRRIIGYVPQQPLLLSSTIIENLRIAAPQASQKSLWQALEWAGLAEEVAGLPQGLHTPLGVWGQQVSGGQRQRLALAIVLLQRPQALILDETFAPLDSEKIREILMHLQHHFSQATWLIITHRQEVRPFVERWETDFQTFSTESQEIGAMWRDRRPSGRI
ncbi:MAG: ABC transporter ATP-binding protein/permease [Bacteroidia bacterium]|nr:ABC transporter ATP-binding protein/permease [Bacteroidia bacterium]MDW8235524.1 ABC transporter ATP-binding protein [Bacteroidia bacterium]